MNHSLGVEPLSAMMNSGQTGLNEDGTDKFDSPKEKMKIAEDVESYGRTNQKYDFPYGIYFGSRIKDSVKNRVGCVVGIKEDYILVAFEGDVEPQIVSANIEFFEKGYYTLA